MDAFSGWLRAARSDAGLSQKDVTQALKPLGLDWHQTKVAKIEAGSLVPRLDEAIALVNLFGATLDAALGLTPGCPDGLASRQAASRLRVLRQIQAAIEGELAGEVA